MTHSNTFKYNNTDIVFPLSATQKNFHKHMVFRKWVYTDNLYTPGTPATRNTWNTHDWTLLTEFTAQRKGEEHPELYSSTQEYLDYDTWKSQDTQKRAHLHGQTWYAFHNMPRAVWFDLEYGVTDKELGMFQFLLRHNSQVVIKDYYNGHSSVLMPIANLYTHKLFQRYTIEDFLEDPKWIQAQTPDTLEKAYWKLRALHTLRAEHMSYFIWPELNELLYSVMELVEVNKFENLNYKVALGQKFRTTDILKETHRDAVERSHCSTCLATQHCPRSLTKTRALTADELLNQPAALEVMLQTIAIWARPFGISIKTEDTERNTHTYKPSHWILRKSYWPTKQSPKSKAKSLFKLKQKLSKDSIAEILLAYNQIIFYRNNEPETFLEDNYHLCPWCHHPIHDNSPVCDICDNVNWNCLPNEISDALVNRFSA